MLTPEKRKTNKMRYEINLSQILPNTNPIEISTTFLLASIGDTLAKTL